jgi:putative ABC transport system permease protein
MKLQHTVKTAFKGLRNNKTRSLLTVLGIVIGVAAIIAVTAVGDGAESLILEEISGLGQETAIVIPGDEPGPGGPTIAQDLTQDDLDALRSTGNVPNLIESYGFVTMARQVAYQNETYRPTMLGGSVSYLAETLDVDLDAGRFFDDDNRTSRRVAVIGQDVKQDLFGFDRAVGKDITIANRDFEIIGVFADTGQAGPFDFDETVVMPNTTAHTYVTGDENYQRFFLRADDPQNLERFVFDITSTLREERDLETGEENNFTVQTQEQIIDQVSTVTSILSAFLVAMVSISLLVGGIGIMNIMLVSVSERTKEIGLRKAIGATKKDILLQFLTEAVALTLAGGVIGIAIGSLIAWGGTLVLSAYVVAGWGFSFPFVGALIGVGVSTIIGLVFGIYPARQAASKSPIEALRYE